MAALQKFIKLLPSPYPTIKYDSREGQAATIEPDADISESEMSVRPYNGIGVRLGQHLTVVGATGSGKSRLSFAWLEYLRRQYPMAKRYVLDSTGDGAPEVHAPLFVFGNRPPDPLTSATYTQIWQPDTDDLDAYNAWMLKILYRREPAIVLLDEIASLSGYSKSVIPLEGHVKLLKQGRKHGITVINETQEIARVPPQMFRQMSYFIRMRMNNDSFEQSQARRYLNIERDSEHDHEPYAPFGFFMRKTYGNYPAREYRSMNDLFGASFRI